MKLLAIGQIGAVTTSPTEPDFYHNYTLGEIVVVYGLTAERYQTVNRHGLSQVMPFDGVLPAPYPAITRDGCDWWKALDVMLETTPANADCKKLPGPATPRTQKARGIFALRHMGLLSTDIRVYQKPIPEDQPEFMPSMARPCPSRPRHGFVDSRVVKTPQELNAVLAETLKHDPHGEVLCMPFFNTKYSAVVTNDSIVFGKGTDGATAGKRAMTIPCQTSLHHSLNLDSALIPFLNGKGHLKHVLVKRYITYNPTHHRLFVETVGKHLVQLRTGPRLHFMDTSTTMWSPREFISPEIVYTVDSDVDFLEYEKKLDELKAAHPDKFIVHFPNGSLLSHLAVQAIAKNVPITTERVKPRVGVTKHFPKSAQALPMRVPFRKACIRGLQIASQIEVTETSLQWAVAIVQGIGPSPKTHASTSLLIAAAAVLMKAGSGICLGEYRHFFDKGPGRLGYVPNAPLGVDFEYRYIKLPDKAHRSSIYQAAFTKPWEQLETVRIFQTYLTAAAFDFEQFPWTSAFGGPSWGNCTRATLSIMEALIPFYRFSTKYPKFSQASMDIAITTVMLNRVIQACNRLITISHNSGRCLTKIIPETTLRDISEGKTGLTIATSPLTEKVLFS